MYSLKVIVLVAVVVFVQSTPQYHPQPLPALNHFANILLAHPTPIVENDAPANYNFGYTVNDPNTQDVKQQQETRVGQNVQGHYSVVEPDGTRRVVHYTADQQNGFNAVVQHEGIATHPAPVVNQPVQVAVPVGPNHVPLPIAYPSVPVEPNHVPLPIAHPSVPVVTHHNSGAVSQANFNLLTGR